MKKNSIAVAFVFIIALTKVFSQEKLRPEKPIELDAFNGKLPFDVPIRFKKTLDPGISVEHIGFFQYDASGCPKKGRELKNDEKVKTYVVLKSQYPQADSLELMEKINRAAVSINLNPTFSKKNDKTIIEFELPPLEPSKSYGIVMVTKPDKKRIQGIIELANLKDTDQDKYNEAFSYDSVSIDCKQQIPLSFKLFIKFIKPKIIEFNQYADSVFIEIEKQKCNTIEEKLTSEILKKIIECKACRDSYKFVMNPDTINQLVNSYRNLNDSTFYNNSIATGIYPLNASINADSTKKSDYFTRVSNYQSSSKSLDQLIELTRIVKAVEPSAQLETLYDALTDLKDCRISSKFLYDSIENRFKKLSNFLSNNPNFSAINFIDATTVIYDFDTRNGYSFTADFGLIYYGENLNNSFSPYLGCHINFRYVDRNIRWKDYPNKTLLHKLSFHIGTTLVSMKRDGRTDNFFNKSALLTGMGYRLGHIVRVTGGFLWFNKENTDPLVDNKKIAATPYIGMSFDLSVQTFMQGFNTFFK